MYSLIKNSVEIGRLLIENHIEKGSRVVDCTLGNGNDTLRLREAIGDRGYLYGFDIQKKALENTRDKLISNGYSLDNVDLIEDGHENIDLYVEDPVDFIIYNLGYLPGGNKEIITEGETTLISIEKSLKLLADNGLVLVISYLSHRGGMEENMAIVDFLKVLNQKEFNVLECSFINQKNLPAKAYIIEKNSKK